MKNYIQSGDQITVAAGANVTSGTGHLVGSIFGIAVADALSGAPVVLQRTGVVEHPKTSAQAWTLGALIYWDNTNKLMTTAAPSGANKLVGVAVVAAANPSPRGRVLLTGQVS